MIDVLKPGRRQTTWAKDTQRSRAGLQRGTSELLLFKLIMSSSHGGYVLDRWKQEQGWRDARLSSSEPQSCFIRSTSWSQVQPQLDIRSAAGRLWQKTKGRSFLQQEEGSILSSHGWSRVLLSYDGGRLQTSLGMALDGTLERSLLACLIGGSGCGGDRPWRALSFQQQHASFWWILALKALLYVYKCDDYAPQ